MSKLPKETESPNPRRKAVAVVMPLLLGDDDVIQMKRVLEVFGEYSVESDEYVVDAFNAPKKGKTVKSKDGDPPKVTRSDAFVLGKNICGFVAGEAMQKDAVIFTDIKGKNVGAGGSGYRSFSTCIMDKKKHVVPGTFVMHIPEDKRDLVTCIDDHENDFETQHINVATRNYTSAKK